MVFNISKPLLIGLGIVVVSNAIVLARAAYNRSGEPVHTLTLTERELSLPYQHYYRNDYHDNSGLSFGIQWQGTPSPEDIYSYYYNTQVLDISAEKLVALGFDKTECEKSWSRRRYTETKAWLALEHDGEQYRKHIAGAYGYLKKRESEIGSSPGNQEQSELKQRAEHLKKLQVEATRLYVVDVALDKNELAQRHTDSGILLLPALIHFRDTCNRITNSDGQPVNNPNDKEQAPSIYISRLLIDRIHIPKSMQGGLDSLPERQYNKPQVPRYTATVAFGRLGEPWLVDLQPVAADASEP